MGKSEELTIHDDSEASIFQLLCCRNALGSGQLPVGNSAFRSHTIPLIATTVCERPKAQSPAINKYPKMVTDDPVNKGGTYRS